MADTDNNFTIYICYDRPGEETVALRQEHLEIHLAYIETILDQFVLAGPLFADASDGGDSGDIIGSILIYRTGDAGKARELFEADPYFKAGLWSGIRSHPLLGAAGDAVGGKTW